MSKKVQFASKIGVIAATAGSAVGLGNVWRFPAEVQSNGGAAFLIVYIGCVLLLGIPVMLSEFALGRAGHSDAVGAFVNLKSGKGWRGVGALAVLTSYLILCFYMVVAGWTLEYFIESLTGDLYTGAVQGGGAMRQQFAGKMDDYIVDSVNPLVYTFLMIVMNLSVLLLGVQKGIERISNIAMPLLFVILLAFVAFSLTLSGAPQGLAYFLNPDFSKIDAGVVVNALGQAFFSLSLGMGILITYSAYYPKSTNLLRTSLTVSLLDMLVAIMVGLIIFPAVTTFGLQGEGLRGATLVFVTLPEVFAQMPLTQLWSVLFFLLLLVATLTSTISISEVAVLFIIDRFNVRRRNACLIVMMPLFLLSSACSLSMGAWDGFKILGMNLFDFLDSLTSNLMLPVGSILLCIYMGWFAPKGLFMSQLSNGGTLRSSLYKPVCFIVKYLAPMLIAAVLISSFL